MAPSQPGRAHPTTPTSPPPTNPMAMALDLWAARRQGRGGDERKTRRGASRRRKNQKYCAIISPIPALSAAAGAKTRLHNAIHLSFFTSFGQALIEPQLTPFVANLSAVLIRDRAVCGCGGLSCAPIHLPTRHAPISGHQRQLPVACRPDCCRALRWRG